jgi:hypothetical protein
MIRQWSSDFSWENNSVGESPTKFKKGGALMDRVDDTSEYVPWCPDDEQYVEPEPVPKSGRFAGELWEQCDLDWCRNEPVCCNCFKCIKHCDC